jgi:hypothetical protein
MIGLGLLLILILGLPIVVACITGGLVRIIALIFSVGLIAFFIFSIRNSPEFMKYYHLLRNTPNLSDPIVVDKYFLANAGESKNYKLEPERRGLYTINMVSDAWVLPASKYQFQGKLEIKIFKNKQIVSESIINEVIRGYYHSNKGSSFYKDIVLGEFYIPSKKKSDELTLSIKVLEADRSANEILDPTQVRIHVEYSLLE